jgi:hypothetical protein
MINSELRSSFLNILNNANQFFNNLSESKKLSYILNPSTASQVNKLGSFLKKVIRNEDRGLLTYLLENADFMFSLLHECFSSSIHLQCEHKRCSLGIFKGLPFSINRLRSLILRFAISFLYSPLRKKSLKISKLTEVVNIFKVLFIIEKAHI